MGILLAFIVGTLFGTFLMALCQISAKERDDENGH